MNEQKKSKHNQRTSAFAKLHLLVGFSSRLNCLKVGSIVTMLSIFLHKPNELLLLSVGWLFQMALFPSIRCYNRICHINFYSHFSPPPPPSTLLWCISTRILQKLFTLTFVFGTTSYPRFFKYYIFCRVREEKMLFVVVVKAVVCGKFSEVNFDSLLLHWYKVIFSHSLCVPHASIFYTCLTLFVQK